MYICEVIDRGDICNAANDRQFRLCGVLVRVGERAELFCDLFHYVGNNLLIACDKLGWLDALYQSSALNSSIGEYNTLNEFTMSFVVFARTEFPLCLYIGEFAE